MAIDTTANAVTIYMPMTFELSGMDVKLFGQKFDMSGTIIVCTNSLDVTKFYVDDNSGASWLSYNQDVSENNFQAFLGTTATLDAIINEISGALNFVDGKVYNAAKRGETDLDASAVFVGAGATWTNYHSLQDFVLSYFANHILGHPGALAAISNDSAIRGSINVKFPAVLEEIKNMTEDRRKVIIQQVMNQDLSRFNEADKGTTQPLKLVAGDKILLQIVLRENTYSLQNTVYAPEQLTGQGTATTANASVPNPAPAGGNLVNASADYYLIEFTLANPL
jgi:hypothetical protein